MIRVIVFPFRVVIWTVRHTTLERFIAAVSFMTGFLFSWGVFSKLVEQEDQSVDR